MPAEKIDEKKVGDFIYTLYCFSDAYLIFKRNEKETTFDDPLDKEMMKNIHVRQSLAVGKFKTEKEAREYLKKLFLRH